MKKDNKFEIHFLSEAPVKFTEISKKHFNEKGDLIYTKTKHKIQNAKSKTK